MAGCLAVAVAAAACDVDAELERIKSSDCARERTTGNE
jgi:hypothetical protein